MKPLVTRFATPEDWPRIRALHLEQNEKWGTHYELPYLWTDNIPVAVVAVDDGGTIREAFYVERTAELRFIGVDPRATAHLRRESEALAYILRSLGYRWLECFVPVTRRWWQFWRKTDLVRMIRKPLLKAGFDATGTKLAHFTRDMRGGSAHVQGTGK